MKRRNAQAEATGELTVLDALRTLAAIERSLNVFVATAPRAVDLIGGRDAMARISEMTCIGAMPRLDAETWQLLSSEHQERQ